MLVETESNDAGPCESLFESNTFKKSGRPFVSDGWSGAVRRRSSSRHHAHVRKIYHACLPDAVMQCAADNICVLWLAG